MFPFVREVKFMGEFYGLVGEKLTHSLSPEIHELILKKINKSGSYTLFQLKKEDLEKGLMGLKVLGARGVNVTIPYKVEIMRYLDNLSKESCSIGAVNTISFKNNEATGYNTDYYGFGEALSFNNIKVKDRSFVVLGTGGVSRAVKQFLIDNSARDIVFVSRASKSIENKGMDKIIAYNELEAVSGDVIVNCTPIGMYPNTNCSPVKKEILKNYDTAIDLIYNPEETLFLKEAASYGLKTQNGLYMLVAQAAAAQEIWNNTKIDTSIISEVYQELREQLYGENYEKK